MTQMLSQQLTEQLCPPQTRAERHLETLLQVAVAISSIRELAPLIGSIMQRVTEAFSADRSSVFLHDPKSSQLWTLVAQGLEHGIKEIRIRDDRGLCGYVYQTRESMCIHDTFEHPQFARDIAEWLGYVPRSMLVVPIFHIRGECEGVLQVMDERVGHFSTDDLPLLEAIAVQVGISLENARLYEAQKRQFHSFVRSFSTALEARDPITGTHSLNVANYAMGIAHHLGMEREQIEWLRIAGLLHDIGKIGVSESVLTKPGRLTAEEFDQMKAHAAYSRQILSQIEFIDELRGLDFIAAAHHEKLDGSGYPDGLRGEQIPLRARILAVADIFDALTQQRHYRDCMSIEQAMREIDAMTPHQLDADCVAALKSFMGIDESSRSN